MTQDFFVLPEEEVNRLLRLKTRGDQHLHGFKLREQIALVVPRTAPPHEAAIDHTTERRLLPVLLGSGRNGYDVLMRQQRDGFGLAVGARPCVQQTVAADQFTLERGV